MEISWKTLILSFVIVYLVAFIGSLFTRGNIDTEWYQSIRPSITPPNWIFPVVWNILFFLIALSLYFVGVNSEGARKKIALVFGINFILNILWSVFYFSMQKPLYAFFDLILLWISIFYLIIFCWKIDKKAGYLLIPYLLWVSFAGVLNWLSI